MDKKGPLIEILNKSIEYWSLPRTFLMPTQMPWACKKLNNIAYSIDDGLPQKGYILKEKRIISMSMNSETIFGSLGLKI